VVWPTAGGRGVWSCLLGCDQHRRWVDGCLVEQPSLFPSDSWWWSYDRSRRVSVVELGVLQEGGWPWLTPTAGGHGVSSIDYDNGCFSVALPLMFTFGLDGSHRRVHQLHV
jgi:hypothetical protein